MPTHRTVADIDALAEGDRHARLKCFDDLRSAAEAHPKAAVQQAIRALAVLYGTSSAPSTDSGPVLAVRD